jgi:hypothetical protein
MLQFEDHESESNSHVFASQNRNPNMNRNTSTLGRFLLLLLTLHSLASASDWTINVNTAMTPDGEKIQHPTTDQPAYYFPYCVGYQEVGSVEAGAKKLSANVPMEHYLAEALASQGYLATHVNGTKLDPSPSLLLVFRWGCISSVVYDDDFDARNSDGNPPPVQIHQYNERAHQQALSLVGVRGSDLTDNRQSEMDLVTSADDKRYYVTIAAYDFAAYYTQHKKLLLWVSRMSIPRQDLELDQVVAPLIKTGTPFLGRETTTPRVVDIGGPNGHVEVGPTVVKGIVAPGAVQRPPP